MTNKPIPEMTDQEIDTALAEFMGWHTERVTYGHPYFWCTGERLTGQLGCKSVMQVSEWHPHDDLNQVWRCVEKMAENGWFIDFFDDANSLCAKFTNIDTGKSSVCAYGSKPARIICETMLMTVMDHE